MEEPKQCRICFESQETDDNELIHPCRCSGTSKYVHRDCINRWRNENTNNSRFTRCNECGTRYTIQYNIPRERAAINAPIPFSTPSCSKTAVKIMEFAYPALVQNTFCPFII